MNISIFFSFWVPILIYGPGFRILLTGSDSRKETNSDPDPIFLKTRIGSEHKKSVSESELKKIARGPSFLNPDPSISQIGPGSNEHIRIHNPGPMSL